MEITTFVLAVKNAHGELQLADERKNNSDLPIGFEPKYAEFLFDFAESRIKCEKGQEIFLLRGTLNTAEVSHQDDFVSAFKNLVRSHNNFNQWDIINNKKALNVTDEKYRNRLMLHLRARHSSLFSQKQHDRDNQVA